MRLLARAIAVAMVATPAGAQMDDGRDAYAKPRLVALTGGRRINLICMGEGAPTVILMSGGFSWSIDWARVQPAVARKVRACAWDRAGNGFSDASPERQDVAHTEADLEAALAAGGVTGPLVLVAHSRGAYEALLFADRHPARMAGMVLVDPATPDQVERLARAAPTLMTYSRAGDARGLERYAACAAALRRGEARPVACLAVRARFPAAVREALSGLTFDAAYWETFLSGAAQTERDAKLTINPARTYSTMPLMVLGSGKLALPGAPAEVRAQIPAVQAELDLARRALLGLSTDSAYVEVPDSGHAIHAEKPGVVITAIERVLGEVGRSR